MIMGEGYELRINESGGDEGYGEKLIYEARSGGVESVERYFIENDDGTITETEVREQTFGTGDEAVTNTVSSTFTYEVDDMGYPGEIISGTETRDGVTTTFGPGMTELSKSLSLTLGDGETVEDYLVAEADLAEIPLVLQGSEGNTYAQTDENDLGSEMTFFTIDDEENKQILGYAEIQDIESQEDDGLGDLELAVENAQVAVDDAELGIGDTQTPLATARDEVDRIEALLTSAEVELDNIGATDGNFVIEYTKTPDSKNYAGVIVGNLPGKLVDDIPFDIGGGATAITARIHTEEAGKVVRMQVADSASSGADANYVHAEVTLENVGWNEVTFDFAMPVTRYKQYAGARRYYRTKC